MNKKKNGNYYIKKSYKVNINFLKKNYKDINKVIFLNKLIRDNGKTKYNFDQKEYLKFLNKFYNDEKFNYLYYEYLKTGDRYIKPSVDHIIPKSKGGKDDVSNLKIISFLENLLKLNTDENDFEIIKKNINKYL